MPEWINEVPWLMLIAGMSLIGAFGKLIHWMGSTGTRVSMLEKLVKTIQKDIKKILERLPPPRVVEEKSPVQLTDFGKVISETGLAKRWARDNAPNLKDNVKGKEEFEIYDICGKYVRQLFDDDEGFQHLVKATAYQHGTNPKDALKVYQVELRDILLSPAM